MAQIFPKWSNKFVKALGPIVLVKVCFVVFVVWYWFSPKHTDVGYRPIQPVPFSHKVHAGNLGIDCKYCHSAVDKSTVASVPPSQTCMNCHTNVLAESMKLAPVRESYAHDTPVQWKRVHKEGDYVYFDHSAHVIAGVSCVSCHGRVDQMEVVKQVESLSMSWCLDCHRNPAPSLVPPEHVTNLKWQPTSEWIVIRQAKAQALHPPTNNCSGCHR